MSRTYSIGELAREFGVTARALRFYEDKLLLDPQRDGINRIYSARDRARLNLVLRGKRVGFSLSEIKAMLDLYDLKDDQRVQLQTARANFRRQLGVLERQRQDLEEAILELQAGLAWIAERVPDGEGDALHPGQKSGAGSPPAMVTRLQTRTKSRP